MKSEVAKALTRDFPLTFAVNTSERTPFPMFGFECDDGWEQSIRKTAEKLEPLIKKEFELHPKEKEFGSYKTIQLKEKFGTGRWYLSSHTDEMYDLVNDWEKETETICETCGQPGKLRGNLWLYTACESHTKEDDK